MKKHAYLVIAHKDDLTFRTLLQMLDDVRNDIYIHMDSKNRYYDCSKTERLIWHSGVYHVARTSVTWGGYSQINAELTLLQEATAHGKYAYYHLLSGEDLPIKSQDQIYRFFEEHDGKEFLRFEKETFSCQNRVKYYYLFQEKLGRANRFSIYKLLNKTSLIIQKLVGVDRTKGIQFQKGTNWFSITDGFARYICDRREYVEKTFRNTVCGDEVFVQTLLHNSDFRKNLYHPQYDNSLDAIMRLIDWNRGNPYVFRETDIAEIKASPMLWARKFDCRIDSNIIMKVAATFLKEKVEQ